MVSDFLWWWWLNMSILVFIGIPIILGAWWLLAMIAEFIHNLRR